GEQRRRCGRRGRGRRGRRRGGGRRRARRGRPIGGHGGSGGGRGRRGRWRRRGRRRARGEEQEQRRSKSAGGGAHVGPPRFGWQTRAPTAGRPNIRQPHQSVRPLGGRALLPELLEGRLVVAQDGLAGGAHLVEAAHRRL